MKNLTWFVSCLAFTCFACGSDDDGIVGDSATGTGMETGGDTGTDTGSDSGNDSGTGMVDPDQDDDGYENDVDCDDTDASVYPGAPEIAGNNQDDDCDSYTDEQLVDPNGAGDFATIQEGINAISDGGVLEILPGTASGPLVVTKDITLVGVSTDPADVVVDGQGGNTLLSAGSKSVTLKNITFQNSERALQCSLGKIVAENIVVKNNGVSSGAGLYGSGCEVNIESSVFDNNKADQATGAGGSIYLENGSTGRIANSTISNSESHQGGGINFTDSVVVLDGNLIQRNTVYGVNTSGLGGAMFTNSNGDIINNKFIENFGEYRGGGLVVDNAGPLVKGNEFLRNQSQNDGGGAFFNVGRSVIEDNLFEDNYSLDDGAGLNGKGGDIPETGHVNHMIIRRNRFINNRALGDGGAVKLSHGENDFTNNFFLNNKTTNRGGAIEIDDEINFPGDGTISRYSENIFIGNHAGGTDIAAWPVIIEPSIHPSGNWAQIDQTEIDSITENRRTANPRRGNGGAINIWDSQANFELSNNLMINNTGTFGGAAIHTHRRAGRDPQVYTFTNNTIANNSAPDYGAVWFEGSRIKWSNNIVANNSGGIHYTDTIIASTSMAVNEGFTYNNVFPYETVGIPSQNGTNGNISASPLFTDSANDDYTLQSTSPSKDSADPSLTDKDNSPADMGAYGGPEGLEP